VPAIALKDEASALAGFLLLQVRANSTGARDCLFMVAPGATSMAADALEPIMHQEFQVVVSAEDLPFSLAGEVPGGRHLRLRLEAGGKGQWQLTGTQVHIAGECELAVKR
jgi:hypothetical protein